MTYEAKVISGGKIVIPAELRRKLGIMSGDRLIFEESDDGQVVLKTYRQIVREVQQEFQRVLPAGISLVDDLLQQRRREAEQESRAQQEDANRQQR